jgi:polyphosphate kinase
MIRLLYQASNEGVKIDLIVRGMCCLRPEVEGLSDHIRVISVVGRFLEHSRIYYFYNHGKEIIFMGSADIMPRNLNQRVEVLFPVEDADMIRHLRDDILEVYLQKNINAWRMQPDGSYERAKPPENGSLVDVQRWFLNQR